MPKLKKKGGKKRVIKAWLVDGFDKLSRINAPRHPQGLLYASKREASKVRLSSNVSSQIKPKVKRVTIIIED